jgi:sugar/nucleoside kinase (ribokinase family)
VARLMSPNGRARPRVLLAGLATVDLVQRVDVIPRPGEKIRSTSAELAAGGPAANAAVTVAVLGGEAVLVTGLGQHSLAQVAYDDLRRYGVRVVDVATNFSSPPTVSAVTVREHDGERTVASHNAADLDLQPPVELDALVQDADVVLLDGHHPRLASATATSAHRRDVPVLVDAGSFKPVLTEILPLVRVCAGSESFRLPGSATAGDTDRLLHELGVSTVIRTHGPGPVSWSYRDSTGVTRGHVETVAVTARDTLGAGDVWHGALAYETARRAGTAWSPDLVRELIERANEVAACRVQRVGARRWAEERLS